MVGGGPAGLFFARLARRQNATHQIDVFEQNPASATYGFGVTLAGDARNRLAKVDPEVTRRLEARMIFGNEQAIIRDGESWLVRYAASGGAIARLELLEVMEALCREVGLDVNHERRIETRDDLAGYDLIVGADGANSIVRGFWEDGFAPRRRKLGNRFAWYGVGKALKPNALSFRMAEGGCFIAHYYAYADGLSTFVAECDARSWDEAGLGAMTDAERKALMEKIFAKELEGERLLENKSVWRRFEAAVAETWSVGNAVLIGDALRVAHFSIGSGTRLAMDDALDLAHALGEHPDDVAALIDAYVARRKPTRDLFTEATVRSFEWYEDARARMKAPIGDFIHDFLTRTGRVDDERLKRYAPDFYRRWRAERDQAADA